MLTIERILELKDVIKWNSVFCDAGLNANTMRSAMHHKRPLRPHEIHALIQALASKGIFLSESKQLTLFPTEDEQLVV